MFYIIGALCWGLSLHLRTTVSVTILFNCTTLLVFLAEKKISLMFVVLQTQINHLSLFCNFLTLETRQALSRNCPVKKVFIKIPQNSLGCSFMKKETLIQKFLGAPIL